MIKRAALFVSLIAACGDPPPLTIKYRLTTGPDQVCMASGTSPAQSCSDVAIPCDAYLGLRIVSPSDPTQAFVSICQPVTGRMDLCSIASIDLPVGVTFPEETLQIEVTLYAKEQLPIIDGKPSCPTNPQFAPNGLPIDALPFADPVPAIGGTAFYYPGDSETVVALGCTKQDELAQCMAAGLQIEATVDDFDMQYAVSPALGDTLQLLVGEPLPSPNPGEYVLNPNTTHPLARTVEGPVPAWATSIAAPNFVSNACLEILEDPGTGTIHPMLACKPFTTGARTLDFTGYRMSASTLQQVLTAVSPANATVPMTGIVIGIVVDYTGAPVANVTVINDAVGATETQYLTSDRRGIQLGVTSSSGVFVTTGAPFGTHFYAQGSSVQQTPVVVGGDVDGKVTIVVLQFAKPQSG